MGREGEERQRGPLLGVAEQVDPARVSVAVAAHPALLLDVLVMALTHAGLHIAGACGAIERLVEIVARRRPHVVLLDSAIDDERDPLRAIARLRAAGPGTSLVILARDLTPDLSRAALAHEVDGLATGTMSSAQLAETLRQVAAGQAVFPAGWISAANRADERSLEGLLSTRQLEVLELLAAGMTNQQIAARLYLSPNTVKFHVRAIYERTGARNRVQAAQVLAVGLRPPDRVGGPHPVGRLPTA